MSRALYEFVQRAFKHDGRCYLCNAWTRSGVRRINNLRFKHMCSPCARCMFTGVIIAGLPTPPAEPRKETP